MAFEKVYHVKVDIVVDCIVGEIMFCPFVNSNNGKIVINTFRGCG